MVGYIIVFDWEQDEPAWIVHQERLEVFLGLHSSGVRSFAHDFFHIVGIEMSHRINIFCILLAKHCW